ncbi:hypothetical protein ACLMJK_001668 [Lecanora helva]
MSQETLSHRVHEDMPRSTENAIKSSLSCMNYQAQSQPKHGNHSAKGFCSLPNEILLQIIDESCLDGIESLACSCRRLYTLAEKAIKQHNSDKRRFSYRRLEWPRGEDSENSFSIQELLLNPRRAFYVKEVRITKGKSTDPARSVKQPFGCQPLTISDDARQDSGLGPYAPISNTGGWRQRLLNGNVKTVAAMLLVSLPNLTKLIVDNPHDTAVLSKMVCSIVRVNYRTTSVIPGHAPSLSKFSYLQVSNGGLNACNTGLQMEIATLPPMHALFLTFCQSSQLDPGPSLVAKSSLTEIDLSVVSVHPSHICRLLSHIQSLQRFKYQFCDNRPQHNPATIIQALEEYASHSLTDLEVIMSTQSVEDTKVGSEWSVYTLCAFQKLRRIKIDLGMIVRLEADKVMFTSLMDVFHDLD